MAPEAVGIGPLEPGWERDGSPRGRLLVAALLAVSVHLAVLLGVQLAPERTPPAGRGSAIEVALVASAAVSEPSPAARAVAPPAPSPALTAPPKRIAPHPKPIEPARARPETPAPRPRPPEPRAQERSAELSSPAPATGAAPAGAVAPPVAAGPPVGEARIPGGPPGVSARPRYRTNPAPDYPVSARRRGQEGIVLLSVLVSASGEPVRIEVRTSSGVPVLDEAAVQAVRRWAFEPGTTDGQAVPSRVEVPIRFELD